MRNNQFIGKCRGLEIFQIAFAQKALLDVRGATVLVYHRWKPPTERSTTLG